MALEAQAIGRVHRLGQKKPVFVTKFVAKGTVEENVLRWNSDKLGTQDGDAAAADGEYQLPSSQPTCGMSCVSVCRAVDGGCWPTHRTVPIRRYSTMAPMVTTTTSHFLFLCLSRVL